nr:GGDEF domain-containing protein [Endozoicomonas sp. G2_1]
MIRGQRLAKKQILLANRNLEHKVQERTAELEQAKRNLSYVIKELEVLAITDSLTNLANRRHFDNQLKQEWKRCLRHHKPLSLILFDVDSFKQYNDRYGHSGGDECLVQIAEMLAHSNLAKRPGDLIARYGGEEFVVLLSDADEDYTRAVAERIRDGVSQLSISHDCTKVAESNHVTVSVGFAVARIEQELTPEDLLVQADEALYLAKHSGRNRVCQYLDTSESDNVTKMHKKPTES